MTAMMSMASTIPAATAVTTKSLDLLLLLLTAAVGPVSGVVPDAKFRSAESVVKAVAAGRVLARAISGS